MSGKIHLEAGSSGVAGPKCSGCFCEILNELANEKEKTGQQKKLLIVTKGSSSPLSIDGTGNPTVFTLVKSQHATPFFTFTFEDEFSGTTPYAPAIGTFIISCHCIAGISFINGELF